MPGALIAMSGGVDSSVAAYLMQKKGFDCVGCTMHLYDNEDAGISRGHTCCSLSDVEDARSVAYSLGMRHYNFNFKDEFREKIIDRFVRSYENGLTPNPCIDCNRFLKFGKLFERAAILHCDYVVTGHYARIEKTSDGYLLKKGLDHSKDQSYALYMLGQEQLAHTMLPLGELTKAEVREIAREHHFGNAAKPDSQDICFVPDGNYARVVELHAGKTSLPGDYIDREGHVLGQHKGIIHYTIGQRKGLGITFAEPRYVTAINAADNTVTIGRNEDLFSNSLIAEEFNWILGKAPEAPVRCMAKARYRQGEQPATASVLAEGRVSVVFDEPQRALTPGQSVVLYDGDIVLGGGVICGETLMEP